MMEKLNMDDLDQVAGGFVEENIGISTGGMSIVCPNCQNADKGGFSVSVLYDPELESAEYKCKCGCSFVCYRGNVILKEDWIAECKKNNYVYPFQ
ncbi:MAG: hypothetical protein IJI25_00095 [Eubacterium sp.]|nr:hypothetical protein [Eubacterium sp.]